MTSSPPSVLAERLGPEVALMMADVYAAILEASVISYEEPFEIVQPLIKKADNGCADADFLRIAVSDQLKQHKSLHFRGRS